MKQTQELSFRPARAARETLFEETVATDAWTAALEAVKNAEDDTQVVG